MCRFSGAFRFRDEVWTNCFRTLTNQVQSDDPFLHLDENQMVWWLYDRIEVISHLMSLQAGPPGRGKVAPPSTSDGEAMVVGDDEWMNEDNNCNHSEFESFTASVSDICNGEETRVLSTIFRDGASAAEFIIQLAQNHPVFGLTPIPVSERLILASFYRPIHIVDMLDDEEDVSGLLLSRCNAIMREFPHIGRGCALVRESVVELAKVFDVRFLGDFSNSRGLGVSIGKTLKKNGWIEGDCLFSNGGARIPTVRTVDGKSTPSFVPLFQELWYNRVRDEENDPESDGEEDIYVSDLKKTSFNDAQNLPQGLRTLVECYWLMKEIYVQ